jgi:hypothetical protein
MFQAFQLGRLESKGKKCNGRLRRFLGNERGRLGVSGLAFTKRLDDTTIEKNDYERWHTAQQQALPGVIDLTLAFYNWHNTKIR